MNARRRSTAEQVKHLNDRCSYPGARMVLAGTVCTKFMFARHTRQRIASTHAIWKTGSHRMTEERTCQADAAQFFALCGFGATAP